MEIVVFSDEFGLGAYAVGCILDRKPLNGGHLRQAGWNENRGSFAATVYDGLVVDRVDLVEDLCGQGDRFAQRQVFSIRTCLHSYNIAWRCSIDRFLNG